MARKLQIGICVLAGGLSRRMQRDKARLRLGRRTLLGHVRALARSLGCPVRIIRRDLVPRCGPLGGVLTALSTSRAEAELFLACDMPFVSPKLLVEVIARFQVRRRALFVVEEGRPGFPFLLPRGAQKTVLDQIDQELFSLRALAQRLRANRLRPSPAQARGLFNVNTPADWEEARARWRAARFLEKPRGAKNCKTRL